MLLGFVEQLSGDRKPFAAVATDRPVEPHGIRHAQRRATVLGPDGQRTERSADVVVLPIEPTKRIVLTGAEIDRGRGCLGDGQIVVGVSETGCVRHDRRSTRESFDGILSDRFEEAVAVRIARVGLDEALVDERHEDHELTDRVGCPLAATAWAASSVKPPKQTH